MLQIGTTIKDLRKRNHLTLDKLASLTGFHKSYISKIENDKRSPTIEALEKICESLQISMNSFFILADKDNLDPALAMFYDSFRDLIYDNIILK